MVLVDLMEENGIMQSLIIGPILRDKASLGVQTKGFQGVVESCLGLTCLVLCTHNNMMVTSRGVWRYKITLRSLQKSMQP
jgi:hypothetical protein